MSTSMPACEALAAAIKVLGTTAVFGLSSDDTALLFVASGARLRLAGRDGAQAGRVAPACADAGKPEGPIFLDCKINGQVPASFTVEAVEFERRKSKA